MIYDIEKSYILSETVCRPDVMQRVKTMIMGKNVHEIDLIYRSLFRDSIRVETQDIISCFIQHNRDMSPRNPFKDIVDRVQNLGSGSYSSVDVVINGNDYTFVVKSSTETDQNHPDEEMVHEGYVGMRCLNKIRSETTGFLYTYGAASCTDIPNSAGASCNNDPNLRNYIFLENVFNAVGIYNVIEKDFTLEKFMKILYQLISSLKIANDKFLFTHWDLHGGNIMIQDLGREFFIPVYDSQGKKYMKTNLLTRIIDYGSSTVKVDGRFFILENTGVDNKPVSYPMRDFCLICCNLYKYIMKFQSNLSYYYTGILGTRKNMGYEIATINDKLDIITRETDLALNFLEKIYSKTGRNIHYDSTSFPRSTLHEVRKTFPNTEVFYEGYVLYNPKYAMFTHDDFLRWMDEESIAKGIKPFLQSSNIVNSSPKELFLAT